MKTVLFLRHAEAAPGSPSTPDHARPLTEAGKATARRVGRFLEAAKMIPDRVLASSATRTQETLHGLRRGWPVLPAETTDALYDSTPADVRTALRAVPDDAASLLLIGHQPTWSATVGQLIGSAQVRMPTAALACVELSARRWADVRFGGGALRWLLPPDLMRPR